MNKEDELMARRLLDLAEQAYQRNTYTYSDFLSMQDQSVLFDTQDKLSFIPFSLWGGVEGAERQIAVFGDEAVFGYAACPPVDCVKIRPLSKKFAENLDHRDFLGALMHLGVERDVLGDIMVKDQEAFLFCHSRITQYIMDELTRVRHTSVIVEPVQDIPDYLQPEQIENVVTVASMRLDVVIAACYHLSRSQSYELLTEQKIYVNGRVNENRSYTLKANDIVSVRGYGKFEIKALHGETKKGKLKVLLSMYGGRK